MNDVGQFVMAIFGGVITLAILSVIVSKKSATAQDLQAASSALANVVAAAVNPVHTAQTNGNIGNNLFTLPNVAGSWPNSWQRAQT